MNMLLNIIKHCNIDLAALLDACDLICILDQIMTKVPAE